MITSADSWQQRAVNGVSTDLATDDDRTVHSDWHWRHVRELALFKSLPIVVLSSLGFQAFYLSTETNWRFELARAQAATGEAIFLVGPIIAAAGAYEAWMLRKQLSSLYQALTHRGRAPVFIWIRLCSWSILAQIVACLSATTVAIASGADWLFRPTVLLLPFVVIIAMAALGVLLGWWLPSP